MAKLDAKTVEFKKEKILVNSRHKSSINNSKYKINAISKDNVIEAIEIPNKRFFLGIQWHLENMYMIDINEKSQYVHINILA